MLTYSAPPTQIRTAHGTRACLLIGAAMLLPGCQALEQPDRLTVAEALTEMRVVNAQEIARTEHGDETMVVFQGQQGGEDAVVYVLLERATQRAHGYGGDTVAGGEPGTMRSFSTDSRIYVYGRITDPAIKALELDVGEASLAIPVSAAGYAIVLDDVPVAAPQCWRFLDAEGQAVYAPAGPC